MDTIGPGAPAAKLVLIVDDDDSVMELFDFTVRKEGFGTEKATTGDEAIKKARLLLPALILLDLMLPTRGGFEVLRELQDGDTAAIPIVPVTGRHMDQSTLEMIKQEPNVKGFLAKPVQPQALASLLHALLKTHAPAK